MKFEKVIGEIYRLKIPFDDLYTSVFLITTENGNILVDCATTSQDVDEWIVPALSSIGLSVTDIKYLVLTHHHGDHAGGKTRLLELNSRLKIIDGLRENFVNGLTMYEMKGHTLDCIGVFDERSRTLIAGDGLQGYGVGKYRCSLKSEEEYRKTINKIKHDKRIENVLFSHAYEPWYKDGAFGRGEVEGCLEDCIEYVKRRNLKMKAIVINKADQSLSYTDVPNPVLKAGEVIIEVYAAALNRADLLQREGNYPPPPGCPEWPGLEVAGIIKEVAPDVTKWKVGDKVCALLGGGGYAEYVSVPAEMVMPIPNGLSYAEAAAIPEVYMTAYLNLFYVGQAKAGETLLMNAGASGLASAVIPMAKAFGLRVITTVLGEDKVKEVAYLNADRVVDTTTEDIAEVLKEEEKNGRPVNIAIDCLAGEKLGECLKYVARGCRWIQIASLAGDMSAVDFRNIFVKNIRIIGSTLRSKTPEEKGILLNELVEKTWCKFESGEVKVKIYKTFPIEQADDAQQVLYRGENVGKVVLIVKE